MSFQWWFEWRTVVFWTCWLLNEKMWRTCMNRSLTQIVVQWLTNENNDADEDWHVVTNRNRDRLIIESWRMFEWLNTVFFLFSFHLTQWNHCITRISSRYTHSRSFVNKCWLIDWLIVHFNSTRYRYQSHSRYACLYMLIYWAAPVCGISLTISESPGSVIDKHETRKYLPQAVPSSTLLPV